MPRRRKDITKGESKRGRKAKTEKKKEKNDSREEDLVIEFVPAKTYIYVRYGDKVFIPAYAELYRYRTEWIRTYVYCPICGWDAINIKYLERHLRHDHKVELNEYFEGRVTLAACSKRCPNTEKIIAKLNVIGKAWIEGNLGVVDKHMIIELLKKGRLNRAVARAVWRRPELAVYLPHDASYEDLDLDALYLIADLRSELSPEDIFLVIKTRSGNAVLDTNGKVLYTSIPENELVELRSRAVRFLQRYLSHSEARGEEEQAMNQQMTQQVEEQQVQPVAEGNSPVNYQSSTVDNADNPFADNPWVDIIRKKGGF